MKTTRALLIFFIIIPAIVVIVVFLNCRREHLTHYEFIVDDVALTHTKSVKLHDGIRWISFQTFVISKKADVQVGDVIMKPKCSSSLFIYRIGEKNSKRLVHEVDESGLFKTNWFCNY